MRRARTFLRRVVLVLVAAQLVGASVQFGQSRAVAATALPPRLVAALRGDRARAEQVLVAARDRLATAALAQRTASAEAGQVRARVRLVRSVGTLGPLSIPPGARRRLAASTSTARRSLVQADAGLDSATHTTASAQARALDADRRFRAIQRASATEDQHDAALGSWHFGSGGPSVSASTIDGYLQGKGSPMAGQGEAFLKAGVRYEVDPRLIVAIAGAESYFGITTCAPFNGWGWGCPSHPYAFTSWAHAIDTVTRGVREGYVDHGLTTVGRIHLSYAPPDAANDPTDLNYGWADNVARFLIEQGGDPQRVDGVVGTSG